MVWALLLSSFAAPVFFRRVLVKQENPDNDSSSGRDGDDLHASDHSRNREQHQAGGSVVTAAVR